MRVAFLLLCAGAVAALPARAQDQKSDAQGRRDECPEVSSRPVHAFSFRWDGGNRAALGISTVSGGMRDTLGLLVTDVVPDGPADKAKIEEGDRLQKVNDTDLRLSSADAGDREMRGLMARRLIRVLNKMKPGDVVELAVYSDGKVRTVKVTTAKASDAFKNDAMFGFDPGSMANTVVRLDDGDAGPMGNLRYEMGPGAFRIQMPPVPPVPPVPPMQEMAPTPMTPSAPLPPPAFLDGAPHTMRIRAIPPDASGTSEVVRM